MTDDNFAYDLQGAVVTLRPWSAGDRIGDAADHPLAEIPQAEDDAEANVDVRSGGVFAIKPLATDDPLERVPASAEAWRIAREFHESYERQAPELGYRTRAASAVPWDQVPEANRTLMYATVADLLERGVIASPK